MNEETIGSPSTEVDGGDAGASEVTESTDVSTAETGAQDPQPVKNDTSATQPQQPKVDPQNNFSDLNNRYRAEVRQRKAMEAKIAQMEQAFNDRLSQLSQPKQPEDVPNFGQMSHQDLQKYFAGLSKSGAQEVVNQILAEQKKEQEAADFNRNYYKQFDDVEAHYSQQGQFFDREEWDGFMRQNNIGNLQAAMVWRNIDNIIANAKEEGRQEAMGKVTQNVKNGTEGKSKPSPVPPAKRDLSSKDARMAALDDL